MGELLSPQQAEERWPVGLYPPDTLGGMQRDIVLRFWELAKEAAGTSDPHPLVVAWLAGQEVELARGMEHIEEIQESGLREAFRNLMGYELPEETADG